MRFDAEIFDQHHKLKIERRDGFLFAQIDDRSYELEVRDLRNAEYLLINQSEVNECLIRTSADRPQFFEVHLQGRSYNIKLVDPRRVRSGQTAGALDHGVVRLQASMPGKVVRVLVDVGADVEAGAGIVVVEAMKMQNEMKAPKSGTVVSLTAVAGATVNAGDVLAIIE